MKQTKQFLRPLLMAIVMMVGMLVPQGAWAEVLLVDGVPETISSDASYEEVNIDNGGFLIINKGVTLTVTGDIFINENSIVINYGTIIGDGCIYMKGYVLANHGHIDLLGADGYGTFYDTGTLGDGFFNLTTTPCNHDDYENLGPVEATCTHGAGTQYKCETCYYIGVNETSERSPHTFDNETDPHHTHCTECKHSWIYYTTTDGEDFEDFEYRFPNAFNHGFDSENNYYYIEFADAMTEITEFGFCEKLATVILPSSVTSIADWTFYGCSSLNSIALPSSLESIGWSAFDGCTSLESITLPNSLESIGDLAFSQSGLTCITIPESVTSIGPGAFAYCESLTTLTTPCTLDLSNAGVPGNAINRLHDEESKRLTAEPVADGLYTYTCDKGCGHYDEHRFIKDFNGEDNHLELTKDGEGNYSTSEDITLADANGFVSPVDFTANSVDYSRQMTNEWGTIVLPFAINYDADNTNYNLYQLTAASNDNLTFTEYASGTIPAGTPMAVKAIGEKNAGKYEITLTAADNAVSAAAINPTAEVGGLTMDGTYTNIASKTNVYFIAQNKFWWAEDAISIAPFRAWFNGSAPSNVKALNILVEEADGIANISNANGMLNGKYMENGRVVIVKNDKKFNLNGQKIK